MCVSLCVIQYLCRWLQYMCATMYTLTLRARVRMFVHAVSLSKAQRCHGNIGQKNKKNKKRLGKREGALSTTWGFLLLGSIALSQFSLISCHTYPQILLRFLLHPFIKISRAIFYLGRNNACTETTCHYDRINLIIVNILVSKVSKTLFM